MEPQWMRQIPSSSICNFFYSFFVIYAVLFALSVIATLGVFGMTKKLGAAGIAIGLQGVVMTLLGGTMMLFYYLICDRALLSQAATEIKENFSSVANPKRH